MGSLMVPVAGYKPFSDYWLQQAVDRVLSNLPPDHTFALVAHADSETGASLSAVVRVADEWKVEATVVKAWDGPFKWGAEVVYSR